MRRTYACVLAILAILLVLPLRAANENINYADLNKIKTEGMQHSQVMNLNSWLADVYAPRLTGSPMAQKAADWIVGKLKEWGLSNAKIEPWENRNGIDRGWTNDKFYMAAVSPDRFPIPGTPTAWTPGTNGLQTGEAIMITATFQGDLAKYQQELAAYKGKLKGKWVLTQAAPDVAAYWDPLARRYTPEQLAQMELGTPPQSEFGVAAPGGGRQGGPGVDRAAQRAAADARDAFLRAEGVLGTLSTAPRGHGIYTIGGAASSDPAKALPAVAIPAEQYGRIARILAKDMPVTIEADIKNTYYPNPPLFNVVGEIPGTGKADEIVLLGAHLDTWHAATGAADDGNGVAAMMEAVRILKATGVQLRRTVRVGFWEAEEQGLVGSREYVSMHFASRQAQPGQAGAPAAAGRGGGAPGPLLVKPDYDKLSVYFNIDNGTGALRGIYTEGNEEVAPIFRQWIEPFRALGMTTVTTRNTGGTDHQSFDAVGLPGFQFIQDAVEYDTVVHHTNLDTYERLQPRDNVQMATIVAGFAYLAANRDEKLPRKPMATPPTRPTTH